jgi:UDP-glucose 4-epimerase
MNILITGIAGLIGSNFAEYICNNYKDKKIIGIDDLSGGYEENIPQNVTFYKINLLDFEKVTEIFKEHKIDLVYHFAAYAAEGLSPFIRKFNYKDNLLTTTHLVNCCVEYDVKRLIFTSSMAVYGSSQAPFDESMKPNPIDPYGVAKYACEMDIQIAGEQHGIDWCIIRPHNVYGKNQNIWDKYRNVLGIWMHKVLNNLPITIYGDGEQTRAFTYIDDILEPLWKAGIDDRSSKQIINLGGIKKSSIKDAANIIKNITDNADIIHLEARHEVKHAFCTWKKSEKLLDFKHETDLDSGLRKMWKWAKKQPKRNVFKWPSYEINKKMYDYWK